MGWFLFAGRNRKLNSAPEPRWPGPRPVWSDSAKECRQRSRRGVEEMSMMDAIRSFLTRLGELTATPAAFGVLIAYFCLWLILDRASLDWHALTTCATLAMSFSSRGQSIGTLRQSKPSSINSCVLTATLNWHKSTAKSPKKLKSTVSKARKRCSGRDHRRRRSGDDP
jgi:hypothetical protein